jgi:hypothetical protein
MTSAKDAEKLAKKIAPLLAGKHPAVASAALADLTATLLAGHFIPGDPEETSKLRENLLAEYIALIRDLIPDNARAIGTWQDSPARSHQLKDKR